MSFALIKDLDKADAPRYETEIEVLEAIEERDAVFANQKSIREYLEDGTEADVSVSDLSQRIAMHQSDHETDEESVPPEPVVEGHEEVE